MCKELATLTFFFTLISFFRIALIKSRLLNRSTLASTIIGVIPTDPEIVGAKDDNSKDNIGTAAAVVQVNFVKRNQQCCQLIQIFKCNSNHFR